MGQRHGEKNVACLFFAIFAHFCFSLPFLRGMRCVVQRVQGVTVTVGEKLISSFAGAGLCVLVGIYGTDCDADMEYIVHKLMNLRVFEDADGKMWAKNVREVGGNVMLISQFTLCHVLKGNKPDFHLAMKTEEARACFEKVASAVRSAYAPEKVHIGAFGEHMMVQLVNDGPLTITIDSTERGKTPSAASSPVTQPSADA